MHGARSFCGLFELKCKGGPGTRQISREYFPLACQESPCTNTRRERNPPTEAIFLAMKPFSWFLPYFGNDHSQLDFELLCGQLHKIRNHEKYLCLLFFCLCLIPMHFVLLPPPPNLRSQARRVFTTAALSQFTSNLFISSLHFLTWLLGCYELLLCVIRLTFFLWFSIIFLNFLSLSF